MMILPKNKVQYPITLHTTKFENLSENKKMLVESKNMTFGYYELKKLFGTIEIKIISHNCSLPIIYLSQELPIVTRQSDDGHSLMINNISENNNFIVRYSKNEEQDSLEFIFDTIFSKYKYLNIICPFAEDPTEKLFLNFEITSSLTKGLSANENFDKYNSMKPQNIDRTVKDLIKEEFTFTENNNKELNKEGFNGLAIFSIESEENISFKFNFVNATYIVIDGRITNEFINIEKVENTNMYEKKLRAVKIYVIVLVKDFSQNEDISYELDVILVWTSTWWGKTLYIGGIILFVFFLLGGGSWCCCCRNSTKNIPRSSNQRQIVKVNVNNTNNNTNKNVNMNQSQKKNTKSPNYLKSPLRGQGNRQIIFDTQPVSPYPSSQQQVFDFNNNQQRNSQINNPINTQIPLNTLSKTYIDLAQDIIQKNLAEMNANQINKQNHFMNDVPFHHPNNPPGNNLEINNQDPQFPGPTDSKMPIYVVDLKKTENYSSKNK
jgi:hypothetical protein